MRTRKKSKRQWKDANAVLGYKLMLCRKCGRKAEIASTVILRANALRQPVRCHGCEGELHIV